MKAIFKQPLLLYSRYSPIAKEILQSWYMVGQTVGFDNRISPVVVLTGNGEVEMDFLNHWFSELFAKSLVGKIFIIVAALLMLVFAPETIRHYLDFTPGSLEQKVNVLETLERIESSDIIKQDKDLRSVHEELKSDYIKHVRGGYSLSSHILRPLSSRISVLQIQNSDFSLRTLLLAILFPIALLIFEVWKKRGISKAEVQVLNLTVMAFALGALSIFIHGFVTNLWVEVLTVFFASSLLSFGIYRKWIK